MVKLKCTHCGKLFLRNASHYQQNLERQQRIFCSLVCQNEGKKKACQEHACKNCGTPTKNPKFCSRACSATYNNRRSPKRKLQKLCKVCGKAINAKVTYCSACFRQKCQRIDNLRLQDVQAHYGSRNSYTTMVRQRARHAAEALGILSYCSVCGYSAHVHCCHIKPVSAFPLTTKLKVVNRASNLVGLCPNHHWEFDHGLLKLPK